MNGVLARRDSPIPPNHYPRSTRSDTALTVGGVAWIAGTLVYFIAQPLVASAWTPGYSWLHNYISDLGNTACGSFAVPHGTTMYVCSPRHGAMNSAFILNGVLFGCGAVVLRKFWPAKTVARRAIALLVVGAVLKVVVGLAPENVDVSLHLLGALNVPLGSVAILMLSASGRQSRPAVSVTGTVLAIIGLAGSALSIAAQFGNRALELGLGVGGMERVATYPGSAWALIVGLAAIVAATNGCNAPGPAFADAERF